MRRTDLARAGLLQLALAAAMAAGNELLDKHADRLVQAADPYLHRGDKLDVKVERSEAAFSRDAVEAAPDTIKDVTFSSPETLLPYSIDRDVPFSRQAVEQGSQEYYGAASINPPAAAASDVVMYEAAVPLQALSTLPLVGARAPVDGFNYYGAAHPWKILSLSSAYNSAYTSLTSDYTSLVNTDMYSQRSMYKEEEKSEYLPLRDAVESRPAPRISMYSGGVSPSMGLDYHKQKYWDTHQTSFYQARPNTASNPGKHYAQLTQTQTRTTPTDLKIVCYYGAWSVYRAEPADFGVGDIDPTACTHLIYSFAGLDTKELTIKSLDEEEDIVKGSYKAAVGLKSRNPALKVMLAIGGWNEGGKKYSAMVQTKQSRDKFIKSVVDLLSEYGFDGLDLDWEYPGAKDRDGRWADRDNFSALVEELAQAFKPRGWILSAAVSAAKFRVDEGYDVKRISGHLDFINVMTYDLHGDWDNFADHHAPLHAREHDSWEFQSLNTEAALAYWHSQGAPLKKLLLGTPFYGRSFTLGSGSGSAPGVRSMGPGKAGEFTEEPGFLAYFEICKNIKDGGWTEEVDSDGNPYIHKDDQWIGYDAVSSIRRKMEFVRAKGLGGAMIWAIDLDDFKGVCGDKWPLLTNMNLILRPQGGSVEGEIPVEIASVEEVVEISNEINEIIDVVEVGNDVDNTVVTEEADKINFICSGPGTFPSTDNCADYYTCTQDGTAFQFHCPVGLHYDSSIKACNWPEAVSCGAAASMYKQGICGGLNDGLYSDPHARDKFFWCRSRRLTRLSCPAGLFFDAFNGNCVNFYMARHFPGMIVPIGGIGQNTASKYMLNPYDNKPKKVICNFANWAGLRSGDATYVPENIPAEHCTHLVYAFASLDAERNSPAPSGPQADIDQGYFDRVQKVVRSRNPSAKVLISLGGWADSAGDKYSKMVNNPDLRATFVDNTVEFLSLYGFDGLVLEWHFPVCWQSDCSKGPASDRSAFSQLVSELKTAFGDRFLLGATLSGYINVVQKAYDIPALSAQLDFLNIMAYDLKGFWDKQTGHHAQLREDGSQKTVETVMSSYVSLGADKSKLIVGIPFYGQSFTTSIAAERSSFGPGIPAKVPGEAGKWTAQPGMLAYFEICEKLKSGGWVAGPEGNYAYHAASHQWVGYDSVAGVRAKAEFVATEGYGGVSVSTLDLDDFNNLCCEGSHPLLSSISNVLLDTPAATPVCGRPSAPVTPAPKPQASTEPWDDGGKYSSEKTTWGTTTTTRPTTTSSNPSTTASTTTAGGEAECVEGEFLKSSNCQQYFRCINGRKELHSCAGGLSWDSTNLRCDWADTVNCKTSDITRDHFSNKNQAVIIGEFDASAEDNNETPAAVVAPVAAAPADGVCSASGGYFAVPGDCSAFFQCVNGSPIKLSCSAGLHFSASKGLCDWPATAGCMQAGGRLIPTCSEGAYSAHPDDCNRYSVCVHGENQEFSCQSGTHWDNNLRVCNHIELAGCTAGSGTGTQGSSTGTTSTTASTTTSAWDSGDNSVDNGDYEENNNNWDSGQWSGDNDWKPSTPKPTTPRPSGPTEAVPLQGPLSGDFKVVCYFTNWAWYRPGIGKYKPEDIDPDICTHIVYGFAVLDGSTGLMKPHDSWADIDNDFYGKVTEFKKKGIKVTVAIGGWNDSAGSKYSQMVNNPARRAKFVEHVVGFIEKYNFDGLDLDWEYPSCWQTDCKPDRYSDKAAFSAWVSELKAAFRPRGLLLSAAVSPSKKIIDVAYDVPSIARDLDWIAVMTYDYHGHWDKKTGHVAPFYEHQDDEFFYFNTNYTINYWIGSGAPANKLVLGMPLYGQAFTLDKPANHGLNAPARAKGQAGEFTRAAGFLAYYEICRGIKRGGWTVVKDPEGRMGPYAYKGNQWVGYDDVETIRRKSEFVRNMGLGGGMVWALDLDDFRNECGEGAHPLMNAMKEVLGPARGQYQPTADNERVVVLPAEMEDNKPESENVEEESVAEPEPEAEPIKLVEEGEEEMAVAERSNEYKVVCYFTNWAWYRPGAGKYRPENIKSELCTHIVYGFAVLDPANLVIKPHDSWADFDNKFYEQVTAMKTKKKKVLLALGGWNDSAGSKYSKLVNNPAARKRFITHAIAFLQKYNFDGLDLDWEYPMCWQVDCTKGPKSDKEAFASWVEELSVAFKPLGLLVTAAVSPSNKVIDAGYDVPKLSKYLDYISVMTYDYHGQWDKQTGHVAPMYQHPEDDNQFFNVNFTVNYWLEGGLVPEKLILGMPMYGQSFTLASAANNGLNSKTYGGGTAGQFTRARGFLAYYEICDNVINKGWKVIQDPDGNMGPYAYKGSQWVSYDDAAMIKHKAQYVKKMGLGGAMIWALDLDDFRNSCGCGSNPLLSTINHVLRGTPAPAPCTMPSNYRVADLELNPSPYTDCSLGNFAGVEGDCGKYRVCNNGEYEMRQCPAGLHWNRDTCDWPENSACSDNGLASIPAIEEVENAIDNEVDNQIDTVQQIEATQELEAIKEPTPQQTPSPVPGGATTSPSGMKVVCYFTNWAWYRQGVGKYTPDDIDTDLCTHINYGFAVLDPNKLTMVPHDTWADIDNHFFEKVAALKAKGVTVSVALGGWNDSEGDKYSRLVNNPSARRNFITEAVKFIEKWGFEGLDLDWEYPKCWQVDCSKGPDSDKAAFADFVRELSAELRPRGWVLSAALSPSKKVIDAGYDVPALDQYLDIFNVMTYDYHGHWDKKTGHVAPLYEHPEDEFYYFNANYTMNYYASLGASKSKLVMGMPMYGQSFSLADRQTTGLNSAAQGRGQAGEYTRAGGFLAYYEICNKIKSSGWTVVKDPESRIGPYAYNGDQWVGYDDIDMIRQKSEFVRDNGFGGGMIWALDLDDFTNRCGCEEYPLLRTINRVLRGYSKPDPSCDARALPLGPSQTIQFPSIIPYPIFSKSHLLYSLKPVS